MFDVDLIDVDATDIADLHARGARVVCYLSAGTVEDWRPDADEFPAEAVGSPMAGWPGERWLDVSRFEAFAPLIEARLDLCAAKGFDGVEPDNVDAHDHETGFEITADDQLVYNRWLAAAAHERGLAIGLKNDGQQAATLVDVFDFAIVEECFAFDECGLYRPFVAAGKAVFVAEYDGCPADVPAGFSVIRKRVSLDAWRHVC